MDKVLKPLNRRKFLKACPGGAAIAVLSFSSLFSFPRTAADSYIRSAPPLLTLSQTRLKQILDKHGGEFGGFNPIKKED